MRAYAWMRSLASDTQVHLIAAVNHIHTTGLHQAASVHLLPRRYPSSFDKVRALLSACFSPSALPPIPHAIHADEASIQHLAAQLATSKPERLVVFRIGMYPVGRALARQLGIWDVVLDLDDLESVNHAGLSRLRFRSGHYLEALKEYIRAKLLRWSEKRVLTQVRTVYVCSGADQAWLQSTHPNVQVEVFKNSISVAPALRRPLPVPHLLFVGTLDYFPNEDAAIWIAEAIVPALRKILSTHFVVQIAGRNAPERLVRRLSHCPELVFLGEVSDLKPVYQTACCALVPLRAGSGTKLKILEAFAYGVPVVATSTAVRGMELVHGEELLLADAPGSIAAAVQNLLEQPRLAAHLSDRALAYLHHQGVIQPLSV
jgi:glycosyltransferase involved in cell wall biosynthesis